MLGKCFRLIDYWKFGAQMIFFIFMLAVMMPIAVVALLSVPVIFLSMIFDFDISYIKDRMNEIGIYSIMILGPYFLGSRWNKAIEEVSKNLNPDKD